MLLPAVMRDDNSTNNGEGFDLQKLFGLRFLIKQIKVNTVGSRLLKFVDKIKREKSVLFSLGNHSPEVLAFSLQYSIQNERVGIVGINELRQNHRIASRNPCVEARIIPIIPHRIHAATTVTSAQPGESFGTTFHPLSAR